MKIIRSITEKMKTLSYESEIGPGYCWEKYMITFRKANIKKPSNAARIYIRENEIVFRLYLPNINGHREYIENAEPQIQEVFINEYGNCKHCHNDKNGRCNFRRTYQIFSTNYEKCSESTIQFFNPKLNDVDEYMELFKEFYCKKAMRKKD